MSARVPRRTSEGIRFKAIACPGCPRSRASPPQPDRLAWPALACSLVSTPCYDQILDAGNVLHDVVAGRIPSVDAEAEMRSRHHLIWLVSLVHSIAHIGENKTGFGVRNVSEYS